MREVIADVDVAVVATGGRAGELTRLLLARVAELEAENLRLRLMTVGQTLRYGRTIADDEPGGVHPAVDNAPLFSGGTS